MSLTSLSELLSLQGYGVYVWPAYVALFAGLGLETWLIRRRAARARAEAAEGAPR